MSEERKMLKRIVASASLHMVDPHLLAEAEELLAKGETRLQDAVEPVTDEDRRMVVYFLREKDDITRWVHWEERKHVILRDYPFLGRALEDKLRAEQTLESVLGSIEMDIKG